LLLFANLAFLAWSEWIDVPQRAPSNDVYARLPRLKLVGEDPAEQKQKQPASGSARKTALQAPPPPTSQCLSIGPFDDAASASRGAAMLHDKGLAARQRTAQSEVSKGFWVYIGGLKTDHDVTQVLHTLEQSHVEDAQLMPDTDTAGADSGDGGHRVSVGLFSERDRADRRAESLQKLGLQPEVAERKVPATIFWLDVDVPSATSTPTAADFASDAAGSHVEVASCPTTAAPPDGAVPLPTAPGSTTPFRTKVATGAPDAQKVP
jgi:hypothetical protein